MSKIVDVITLDGPSGTGKGTIANLLAKKLQWQLLDSGAIYRALAWAVIHHEMPLDEINRLLPKVSVKLVPRGFDLSAQVFCNQHEITQAIRHEEVGMMASKVAALPAVRQAVLVYQRSFRVAPGLIADGRDMGTVVFPDSRLKFYLDAKAKIRAERRCQQLQARGDHVSLREVEADLAVRDHQDAARAIAPLKPADDAHVIDTSHLTIEEVFDQVMACVRQLIGA